MRINVRHLTRYTYATPSRSAIQMLRATPRACANQFVRRWRVEVDADARLEKSEDAYGNIVHTLDLEGPLPNVSILIEGEVDTSDLGGVVSGTLERQPSGLFLRETPLTAPTQAIRDLARDAMNGEGGDALAALHKINADLHDQLTFDEAVTDANTTAAEAFEGQHGVCQDFAHIFVAAARTLCVPARYVSGYYLRSDVSEQTAGHAWAEAFVPKLGWIGFDPAQGMCVTERHLRVAIGCDYREAAPVRGVQTGGTAETLSVAIDVSEGGKAAQSQSQSQGPAPARVQAQSQAQPGGA